MPIYGSTFKVNRVESNSSGFRIIADGNLLLNTEIPVTKSFEVADSPQIGHLDFKEALKKGKGWLI